MDSSITNDATMEPQAITSYQQILDNVLAQKLEQNEKRTKAITDYKKGHKKVIEGLEAYPLSLSENCMVPIGKLAFMRGKLTHTNEILIYLGEGYFVKYSASQAIALCNRRIAWADEMLKSLETEKNLYEMRQYIPLEYDVFGKDRKDIVEHWTENKLDEWKMQHRQREKEYRQKLTELKEKERIDIHTEEDLFKRLNQLEVEEALEDEIYRLETERKAYYDLKDGEVYDESEEDESDSDQITTEKIQEELKKLKDIQMDRATSDTSKDTDSKEKRRISFAEPCVIEDESNTKEISISREVCSALKQDDTYNESSEDENDAIRIEFSHSSHSPDILESNNMEIQSPVDIYKMFNAPKSILKRSPNDMIFNEFNDFTPLNENSSTDTEDEAEYIKRSAYNSVIKEVVQESKTSPVNVSTEKDEKRIVSKFKLERAGRK